MLVASKWKWPAEHINVKEARVALWQIRRAGRVTRNLGRKHVGLSDSLVSIGAFEKGRAKSWALQILCQRAAAYQLAGEMFFRWRYVESERNVADEGSRRHDPLRGRGDASGSVSCIDRIKPQEKCE